MQARQLWQEQSPKFRRRLFALCGERPVPPSLLRLLLGRLERRWHGSSELPCAEEEELAAAAYKTRGYVRRRAPNEIEVVGSTIDDKALEMVAQSFQGPLSLAKFAEALVKTGTYDADHVLAFVGGVVDLFLEVRCAQGENALEGQDESTVNWCQLMNHFIESPEIAMYEGSEVTVGMAAKAAGAVDKQISRNSYVDRAKHFGPCVEKLRWIPHLEMLATLEGTESAYLWPASVAVDAPKALTPELPQEGFYDKNGKPLYKVLAMDWDPGLQDLAVLLSNRMLIVWRLRSKERCQFQQKRELRFGARRTEARGDKEPEWRVFLNVLDPKTMESIQEKRRPDEMDETSMRRDLREQRLADEASAQLDIWFNQHLSLWVTTDGRGRLFMWDLRQVEGSWLEGHLHPARRLSGHTRLVTSHLELSRHKFTTASLDRSILLWDNRRAPDAGNLCTPEIRIADPTASVLAQAYLPLYNMLVVVGCEKIVGCYTIDSTAYRGVRKKLSGHKSNVQEVAGGATVFFTLDEAFVMIVWDGLSLAQLQTLSCSETAPRHLHVLPQLGKVCAAGRRLSFYEGNEHAAIAMGAAPTKDFEVRARIKQEEGASLKERAPVKWVGLAERRGTLLSATGVEVRQHTRGNPERFRSVFNPAEGDFINDIAVSEPLNLVVLGTAKGSVHFLKYRSGCALKVYAGRRDDRDRGLYGGKSKEVEEEPDALRSWLRSDMSSEQEGRSKSPAGHRSPAGRNGTPLGSRLMAESEAPAAEEDGAAPPESTATGGSPPLANAPTQEELARGLSRSVKCVLTCEEERLVYAGTAEGQVILFRCDGRLEFPAERWVSCPDLSTAEQLRGKVAAEAPAVTCLHCAPRACVAAATEEEAGLLLVGTQDGAVHLYHMLNLKLAGSVNIAKALPSDEEALQRGDAVLRLRLFQGLAAEPGLPLTLLTVDAHSRLRLWGLQVHVQEWKLTSLKLLLEAGQLLERQCLGGEAEQAPAPKGKEVEGPAWRQVAERRRSGAAARITADAVLPWRLVPPSHAVRKQPVEGPQYAADARLPRTKAEVVRLGQEANGKPEEPAAGGKKRQAQSAGATGLRAQESSGAFLTQPRMPKASEAFREDFKEGHRELSGSESEGDADEVVGGKLLDRPRSPARPACPGAEDEEAAEREHEHLLATSSSAAAGLRDGQHLLFLADAGGWIWCVDIAATLQAAPPPLAVNLQPSHSSPKRSPVSRRASSVPQIMTTMEDERGLLATRAVPHPEAVVVVGAWPAHPEQIVSLTTVACPPALVSADAAKEVKVWSPAGDLWGHFSMRGDDPKVAVWPPPHVLAAQVALMRAAKTLCRKMGFTTRRKGRRGTERLLRPQRRHTSKKLDLSLLDREKSVDREKSLTVPQDASLDVTLGPGDLSCADDAASVRTSTPVPARKRAFTTAEMSEMIRNRGFSSGCQSYQQFARRPDAAKHGSWRSRNAATSVEEAERSAFLARAPSAFGVELLSDRDAEAWESSVKTLGKSASEGALLRYAQTAVAKEALWVRETLGVDVSQVTRQQLRRPSFLLQLDNWPAAQSPNSATAQAVRRLSEAGQGSRKVLATPPLVSAGAMAMGRRRH